MAKTYKLQTATDVKEIKYNDVEVEIKETKSVTNTRIETLTSLDNLLASIDNKVVALNAKMVAIPKEITDLEAAKVVLQTDRTALMTEADKVTDALNKPE